MYTGTDNNVSTLLNNMSKIMATINELLAQKAALEKQINELLRHEKTMAISNALALIEKYNLKQNDLFKKRGNSAPKDGRSSVKIKYRDPISGETWSGRGKEPSWIINQDRNQFKVL